MNMPTAKGETSGRNGAPLRVFANWSGTDERGRVHEGEIAPFDGVEGEVFEELAHRLPSWTGLSGSRLRDAWRFALDRDPHADLANLFFVVSEGLVAIGVFRRRFKV
jgi:hypothetical protein